MLSTDLPSVPMVQYGLFDQYVDREELARGVSSLPLSERAILRIEEGSDSSGNRRDVFGEEVETTLAAFFHSTKEAEGYETAVLSLFKMVSKDPEYHKIMPTWMRSLFEEEKDLLMSAFWSNSVRIEQGESDEDEETEPCCTEPVQFAADA